MGVYIKSMEMPKNCDSCRIMVLEDTNCVPELFCGCPIVFKAHPQGEDHRPDYCPLIEVPEQKHGKWLITDRYHDFMDGTELTIWKCSECGDEFSLEGERPIKKYCSNCGARMDGDL